MLQVAKQYNRQRLLRVKLVVQFVADCKEIQQGLRGVFARTISCVQDWLSGTGHDLAHTTSDGMPKDRCVNVAFQTLDSVHERLALFRRGGVSLSVHVNDRPSQTLHCGLETTRCSSGRFVKDGGQDSVRQSIVATFASYEGLHLFRHLQ